MGGPACAQHQEKTPEQWEVENLMAKSFEVWTASQSVPGLLGGPVCTQRQVKTSERQGSSRVNKQSLNPTAPGSAAGQLISIPFISSILIPCLDLPKQREGPPLCARSMVQHDKEASENTHLKRDFAGCLFAQGCIELLVKGAAG